MKLDWISIVYLLGAAQGGLFLIGINLRQPLLGAFKQILSVLLLTIVIIMIYYLILVNERFEFFPYIDSLGSAAWMAICPLYLMLSKSLIDPTYKLSTYHVLWLIVPVIYCVEGFLNTLGVNIGIYTFLTEPQLYMDMWIVVFFGTGFYFLGKSILALQQAAYFKMRKTLMVFSSSISLVLVVFALIYLSIRTDYTIYFEYTLIGLFECFIFALLYRLFMSTSFQSVFTDKRYENQSVNLEKMDVLEAQLEVVMLGQKPFLNNNLKLSELSAMSDIGANDLSMLFSQHLQTNFYNYVNGYRLDYVETLFEDPSHKTFTISGLSETSGFKNKATFYKVFKERHGVTPSAYIKEKYKTS